MIRASLALLVALVVGCQTRVYQLRLEPTDAGLGRTLTVWVEQAGDTPNRQFAPDELKRLKQLYAENPSAAADLRQTFHGKFAERMPVDVGGHGTYRAIVTPLGSAHWYWERFRGTTDPSGELYDRRAAVDRIVDLIVAWFDEQLEDAPQRDAVHRFLERDLRQDARNVALYFWLAAGEDRPETVMFDEGPTPRRQPDPMLAAIQYLIEHEYLDATGVGGIRLGEAGAPQVGLRTLRRLLAKKTGRDVAEADALFPFLVDVDAVRNSWREHLRRTPEYARRKVAWKPDPQKPDEVDGPNPEVVLEDLFLQAVTFELTGSYDELRLTLVVPSAPHETNGDYDAAGGTVLWRRHVHDRRTLPTICYAAWAVPNERYQTAHFGAAPLAGETLAKFAAYYGQLNAEQQADVAAHLKSIEPGDALRGRARDFRFTVPADENAAYAGERLFDILYDNL